MTRSRRRLPVTANRPMLIDRAAPRPEGAVSTENLRLRCALIEMERTLRRMGAGEAADDIRSRYGIGREAVPLAKGGTA